MATKNELEQLKSEWYRDPIRDIYETEAEKLGLVGLYKLLIRQEEELKELRRNGNNDY